jgi:MFS family permease
MPLPLCLPKALRPHAAWFVLAACSAVSIATFSGHTFGWAFLLPSIRLELELTLSTVSVLWAVAVVATAPCLLLAGQCIERWGQLKVALAAAPLWVLAVYGAAAIGNSQTLTLAMFVLRLLGPGILCMCAQASIGHWFDRRRGVASLLFTSFNWLMLVLQGRVELLVRTVGWRSALQVLSGVYLLILTPALLLLRDQPEPYDLNPDGSDLPCSALRRRSPRRAAERRDVPNTPLPGSAAQEGLTRGQVLRCPAFWATVVAHMSIEFCWAGSQLFLVEVLGQAGLTPAQVGTAQLIGSVSAVTATIGSGLKIDQLDPPHTKRWVLVGATGAGAIAAFTLIFCDGLFLGCVVTSLMGIMMGPLDVVMLVLYPALFGRAHLGSILGLVNTLVYLAIGSSPLIFGHIASLTAGGSFRPIFVVLVVWMPLSAIAVALVPPPRRQWQSMEDELGAVVEPSASATRNANGSLNVAVEVETIETETAT